MKTYLTTIERIELLKLEHAECLEFTEKINDLNEAYNNLCVLVKNSKKYLEELNEFLRMVHDELHYLNQIEDLELNRDWSQPNKLKSNELLKHKQVC